MKFTLLIIPVLISTNVFSQTYPITGKVIDENNTPLQAIEIQIKNEKDSTTFITNKDGAFTSKPLPPGFYYVTIHTHNYEDYADSFTISKAPLRVGVFTLHHVLHNLREVKIAAKAPAVVQKDDTLEFTSDAFKVNPDADASDLIRKMPTIGINGSQVTAQGETVTKVLVDGKPFFGDDPYAALKNLPADMIDKVQVYNEKPDQEQFDGFSEGVTTKTINIITQPGKRAGIFGKIYGGYGPPAAPGPSDDNGMYGSGFSVNRFNDDQRITATAQSNNVNIQNFTNDNPAAGDGGGLSQTNAGGVNYNDKWGKKVDIDASYFFNETDNNMTRDTRKNYLLSVDSGQVYNETSPSANKGYGHNFNMRFNYTLDTMNSILLQPQVSFRKNYGNTETNGNTEEGGLPLNQTINGSLTNIAGINFSDNLLLRHKFRRKGRTFSLAFKTSNNSNDGTTIHTAQDIYYTSPALNDTINQQSLQNQSTWNINGNATYTEPTGKTGLLKLEYNITYTPAVSKRNTNDFSYITNSYSNPDNLYSNDFESKNLAHKAGASYQIRTKKAEFSFGLNYQLTELQNTQQTPVNTRLRQDFQNVLPVATLRYKFSKTKNLQCTYNTNTQAPSVNQLQNVVNNTDPLHLYAGNPSLLQPYQHNLTLRYNATGKDAKNTFSASVTGTFTQHGITSSSIIAASDTTIGQNLLAKGSQLAMPVNIEGNRTLNANISYGMPLAAIKCQLSLSLNGAIDRTPAIINNEINIQENQTCGLSAALNSNISENVDFTLSSDINAVSNENSINTQLNTTYINGNSKASINIIFRKAIVFNTNISYQTKSGLSAGYDQNYAVWNMSLGKKIFKKRKGDIRLSVFDILDQNNNIQHTVTDTYIQDTRTNILQRYLLLVFTYKLMESKGH